MDKQSYNKLLKSFEEASSIHNDKMCDEEEQCYYCKWKILNDHHNLRGWCYFFQEFMPECNKFEQ